jgi:hypothetical protein
MGAESFVVGDSEPFVQGELLEGVGVAVGIKLADVGISGPLGVVDSSPSDLQLTVSGPPAREFSVGEDSPSMAQLMTLLESSVGDHILFAAEAAPYQLDIVYALSESV